MILIEKVDGELYAAVYIDVQRDIYWESTEPMGRYALQDMLIDEVGAYPVDVLDALQWASARGLYYDSYDPSNR